LCTSLSETLCRLQAGDSDKTVWQLTSQHTSASIYTNTSQPKLSDHLGATENAKVEMRYGQKNARIENAGVENAGVV